MGSFPAFLLSMAESNLILRSCCEAAFTTFPCNAVSLPAFVWLVGSPRSRMALRTNLIILQTDCAALAQSPAAVSDVTATKSASQFL